MLFANVVVAFAAGALEAALGYPQALYRAIGHPVAWMGAWLAWLERRLNRAAAPFAARRRAGFAALALYLAPALAAGLALLALPGIAGLATLIVAAASLPAQRSLHAHVRAVADALGAPDGALAAGRRAVAHVVALARSDRAAGVHGRCRPLRHSALLRLEWTIRVIAVEQCD